MMKFALRTTPAASYRSFRRSLLRDLGKAAAYGADQTAKRGREAIQGAMGASKLGKLARAVRYSSDLKKRRVPGADSNGNPTMPWRAGGIIFLTGGSGSDRGQGAFKAYSEGTVITPRAGGRWLAYATKAIPKRVGRYKMTPARYVAGGFEQKIGPLVFIPGKSAGEALLIVPSVTMPMVGSGTARQRSRTGRVPRGRVGHDFIVAFVLIRTTSRAKRFDPIAETAAEWRLIGVRIADYLRRGPAAARQPIIFASGGTASGFFTKVTRI